MAGGDNEWDNRVPFARREGAALAAADTAQGYCEAILVSKAVAVPGFVNDTWFALATGEAPCANMAVQLVPRIYVIKPDYWAIDMIGCVPGACLEAIKPYDVWLDVTDFRGHKGIEIVGSNQTITISIP